MSTISAVFQISLLVATFLCTVVFGEMLVFQTVVMPGIAKLDDGAYLRAFQVIDGVIQDNEPIFVATWIGSVLVILASIVIAIIATAASGIDNVLTTAQLVGLIIATLAWLVCQRTTFTINVPLNNRVKFLDLSHMNATEKNMERKHFEGTWLKWHLFRTIIMGLVSVYLLILVLVVE
ncbi:Domain of unknown function (DUF1772) [Seminavis robusta]|uniref:DUF1772 domain-containing protein n=1 Tax=Seminavis robusta TaxID=568900 RepID=A0A9N8HQX2_9STRA|nr:Domain of unknown function (DUF1772) [Seminavis robusta]|eukprot:Sro1334_g263870.1 Domain of unknown function (DUF1772) (178) ;mRNA; f:27953-28486